MTTIRKLADDVINKIAAGEVVERPSSVIKELVENSLDAEATRIKIELQEGGLAKLAVSDNGRGIARKDAPLVFERHATSKIDAAEDLYRLSSMGFRGEALAAISAVSRIVLQTALASGEGTRIEVSGGSPVVSDWQGARGTTLTVTDLFFNLPVRKAFLKSAVSEYAHCLETVQALALGNPQASVVLEHNGREVFSAEGMKLAEDKDWLGEAILRGRTQSVLAKETVKKLLYVAKENRYGRFEALISPPGEEKAHSKLQFYFVNGRHVKDKTLRFATMRAYHSHLLKGKHPVVVAFLRCDPSLVDVNIHPTKAEVRFQFPSEVQALMIMTMKSVLRAGAWAQPIEPLTHEEDAVSISATPLGFREPIAREEKTFSPIVTPQNFEPRKVSIFRSDEPSRSLEIGRNFETPTSHPTLLFDEGLPPTAALARIDFSRARYLGAMARCYLFFSYEEQLLVVDQHAFHERILYERLCKNQAILKEQQPLFIKEALELAPSEMAALRENLPVLEKLGFDLKILGATAVEISAVPSLLKDKDLEVVLTSIVKDLGSGPQNDLAFFSHDLLATIACHSAVRKGEELGEGERTVLLREANDVDFYLNCPHGRRVLRFFNSQEIGRWFDR